MRMLRPLKQTISGAFLISSAITAGNPSGCSAAYSPSAYLTLPKQMLASRPKLMASRRSPGALPLSYVKRPTFFGAFDF
uniref:Uncharacterized protein n=1 Tax=Solanum tuberosum TaxID=4113 RepID=M1CLK0_SOLTU